MSSAQLLRSAKSALLQENLNEALDYASQALNIEPNNPVVYTERAVIYQKMSAFDKAEADTNSALRLQPDYTHAYKVKAQLLIDQHRYEDAKKVYYDALRNSPQNVGIRELLSKLNQIIVDKGLSYRTVHTTSDDLECVLCLKLFYDPVTTPCGHSFCKQCLLRAMDHNPTCPLCRRVLHYTSKTAVSITLQNIVKTAHPAEYQQRCEEMETEVSQTTESMPLFLLNITAYPGIPFPMHIFEPRYRLMIRRCMEGSKRFGLVSCRQNPVGGGWEPCDVGCCLEIKTIKLLQDGRSFIDCIGVRRFKILEHWVCDGYRVAKIDYLPDETGDPNTPENKKIVRGIYDQLLKLMHQGQLRKLAALMIRFSGQKEMEIPLDDPSKFSYWVASYLPLTSKSLILMSDFFLLIFFLL